MNIKSRLSAVFTGVAALRTGAVSIPAASLAPVSAKDAARVSAGKEKDQASVLLDMQDVSKQYGAFRALDGISFQMKEGEIISVLGPSGCGKSTLLQLVAGLAKPDGGAIRLGGKVIASPQTMMPPEKRGINMVFQDYALWPHMNVEDNIAYGLHRLSKEEKRERVSELLKLMRLEGLAHRLPPQLSGGQQQRVAIARALATRPKLILLDEPLSNLDMRLRIEMRAEMAYLFRRLGTSVFHVTHDPEEAFSMADRLLIMRKGNIDQIGTPQECFSRPASRHAASLLGAINRLQGTKEGTSGGTAIRLPSDGAIYGISGAEAADAQVGSAMELLFRPEDLVLTEEESFEAEGNNKLRLRIRYCTFEGNRWRSAADTTDGQPLYLLTDFPLDADQQVVAALPASKSFLYAKNDD
ncbi:ABC transporter ATP-binding protein [Paenibacillus sp. PAMC21692]|uniref:ABC transporter ATP-binding protein n=1 Tax=Paenibacillus sp. PAMC21692 TaxID=2762320 RepID=UPI0021C35054|nr:ABC transporter ATP-binding protein [Paenibacillus sp. PAMC21692]